MSLSNAIAKIDSVKIDHTAGSGCPADDIHTRALEQLRSSVNNFLLRNIVLTQSEVFGGPGGGDFDDYHENIVGIMSVNISKGYLGIVDIQVTYKLKNGNSFLAPVHGGHGDATVTTFCNFTLADGERLTGIEAKAILIAKTKLLMDLHFAAT